MVIHKHKIIFVHKGAFGDFLQTWPSIFSVYNQFKDRKEFYFAGRKVFYPWLSPLNIKLLDKRKKMALDRVYGDLDLPHEMRDFLIIWFVLKKIPTTRTYENIFFLKGIGNKKIKVWQNYLNHIGSLGITGCDNWHKAWLRFFVGDRAHPQKIIIFPGSGHRLKNWPISRYIELAERIKGLGEKVSFVLGPVEYERGFSLPDSFETIYSFGFEELQNIMLKAKLIIGNDSGPMHLAGFNGIPNITIFGPTDPHLWAPIGSNVIRLGLPCSPCTSTINIKCNTVACIDQIGIDLVYEAVLKCLAKHE